MKSEVKWCELKWSEVKYRDMKRDNKTSKSGGKWKMGSEVKWIDVKIFGRTGVLSWGYS